MTRYFDPKKYILIDTESLDIGLTKRENRLRNKSPELKTKEMIIRKYNHLLKRLANKYKRLGYDDIYEKCVEYLLEAYEKNHKNPNQYIDSKIKTYAKKEERENNHVHYGLWNSSIRLNVFL